MFHKKAKYLPSLPSMLACPEVENADKLAREGFG
jgi:hypothetical protein